MLKNISLTIICSRCNNLDVCHVPVHSDVLPSVCPDTPKYLEAQYQCVSRIKIAEDIPQPRFPRLGGIISDMWSDINIMLNIDIVEDALETVMESQKFPITEQPAMMLVYSKTNADSTDFFYKCDKCELPKIHFLIE